MRMNLAGRRLVRFLVDRGRGLTHRLARVLLSRFYGQDMEATWNTKQEAGFH